MNVRLLAVVALILDVLEKLVESIDIHDITTKIIDNIESFGLLSNNYHFKYQATT